MTFLLQIYLGLYVFTVVLGFLQAMVITFPPLDLSQPLTCLLFSLFVPLSTLFVFWLIWGEIAYRIDIRRKRKNARW